MTRQWLKRQIISYLPVFFLLTFVLLTVMFLSIAQLSKNAVVSANGVFARHVQQVVDYNLKTTERLVLNAVLYNEKLKQYFSADDKEDKYYWKYEISNELAKLKVSNSMIDSIYLYRMSDESVLTENMLTPLVNFGDQAFIQEIVNSSPKAQKWSNARIYQETKYAETSNKVVTFASRVTPPSGELGVIVVNVKVKAIEQLVNEMSSSSDVSYANLIGTDDHNIYDPQNTGDGKQLHQYISSYTGWELHTGIKNETLYQFGSWVYYVFFSIGIAVLLLGTLWIIYTARSNYKPIQSILGRITSLSSKPSSLFQDQSVDEFKFIEAAFEDLFERVTEYEKEQEEGLISKRRHMLKDLTDGSLILQEAEWKKEMSSLRLSSEFTNMCIAVVEVDRYAEFGQSYSNRDQYLLKFIINSVLKEIADHYQIEIWAEWLESHRLCILFLTQADLEQSDNNVSVICNRMVDWVQKNLEFSITLGVSQCVADSAQIYHLYDQAQMTLNYKSVKGNNQVITQVHMNEIQQGEAYKLIHYLRSLSYYFRMGEVRWKDEFEIFFQQVLEGMYAKSEVYYLINDLINHLYREIMELSDEFQVSWKRDILPRMNNILKGMETVEETKIQMLDVLLHAEQQFQELRDTRKHHALMQNVRKYIEEQYSNPELSLKHLEDEFGMNGKYLSFLFREEIGVKFVDYLSQVRLENAKVLLTETQLSVQDTASQVGYTNSMTFIRGFKKYFGMTPGDYRKM
jgi:YesN/AraC family two-component response regulator